MSTRAFDIDFLICSAAVRTSDSVDLNLGDEAISECLADAIQGRLGPDGVVSRTINTRRSQEAPGAGRTSTSWAELFRTMRRTRVVVFGGGTLIQGDRGIAYYGAKVALISLLTRTPMHICAIGVEATPPLLRQVFRLVVARATTVSVRDAGSLALLQDVSRREAVLAADPLFLSPRGDGAPAREGSGVAVSLRGDAGSEFVEALAAALKARGDTALAVATDRRPESDERQLRRLFESAGLEWCEVPREATWQETVEAIGGSGLCIAMRLHACIFAVLAGVPTVVVTSENKTRAFAEELGLASVSADSGRAEIDAALSSARAPDPAALSALRRRAGDAIDLLLEPAG